MSIVSPVYAQGTVAGAATLCELPRMVVRIFNVIWPVAGIALLFMFILGGATWMLSTGDPQRVAKATSTMLWAVVGIVILALVMVIMGTFEDIFGLAPGSLRVFNIPECPDLV